jgi:hypothetical protein
VYVSLVFLSIVKKKKDCIYINKIFCTSTNSFLYLPCVDDEALCYVVTAWIRVEKLLIMIRYLISKRNLSLK